MINSNMLYSDFLNFWFETYKKPYLKKSSLNSILRTIKNDISITIKNMRLCDLKVVEIDKCLAMIDLSRSRKYAYYVYHNSLLKAFNLDLLKSNIAEKIEKIKHKPKKSMPLTIEEQDKFLKKIKGTTYENAFKFLLYSGLRRNELINLEFKDFHLKDKYILVRGTKNEYSNRVIPLTELLLDIYLSQKAIVKGERVFPYHSDTLTHHFKKYCRNHHLHELRHTFITRCAESNLNINVVSRIVGHSNISTTIDIYTRVNPNILISEIKKLKI